MLNMFIAVFSIAAASVNASVASVTNFRVANDQDGYSLIMESTSPVAKVWLEENPLNIHVERLKNTLSAHRDLVLGRETVGTSMSSTTIGASPQLIERYRRPAEFLSQSVYNNWPLTGAVPNVAQQVEIWRDGAQLSRVDAVIAGQQFTRCIATYFATKTPTVLESVRDKCEESLEDLESLTFKLKTAKTNASVPLVFIADFCSIDVLRASDIPRYMKSLKDANWIADNDTSSPAQYEAACFEFVWQQFYSTMPEQLRTLGNADQLPRDAFMKRYIDLHLQPDYPATGSWKPEVKRDLKVTIDETVSSWMQALPLFSRVEFSPARDINRDAVYNLFLHARRQPIEEILAAALTPLDPPTSFYRQFTDEDRFMRDQILEHIGSIIAEQCGKASLRSDELDCVVDPSYSRYAVSFNQTNRYKVLP